MYEDYLTKALSNIIIARQALDNYELIKKKDMKNCASYHAQQAIELILKYCIYNSEKYVDGDKQIYSHDLDKLIVVYCMPYDIYVPKRIVKNAKMYTTWEAESRYSLHYSVRLDSIEKALTDTESWLIELKPSYKSKILNVKRKLGLVT